MKEFFIGLLVLLVCLLLSVIAVLLIPFIVVLGFFLKTVLSLVLVILGVWVVGKVTLWGIDCVKKDQNNWIK